MTNNPPLIISLVFSLANEQGHIYSYNLSVGKAARLLGWEHLAAVRAAAQINPVPDGWQMCLGPKTSRFTWSPLIKIEKMLKLIQSLVGLLNQQATQPRPVIYLLEWFAPMHFIAFCVALLLARHGCDTYVWILYRITFPKTFMTSLYQFIHVIIRWRLTRQCLVILSETDIVAKTLVKTFKQPTVYLLPMPQIISPDEPIKLPAWGSSLERQHKIVCWWPGVPSVIKGLKTIEHLTRLVNNESPQICLIADQKTDFTSIPGGCQVILLPTGIPRTDYLGWLYTIDLALLPYDPQAYSARTSGPFADAIIAGKPPVVTAQTWMAHELHKYDLDELILDWTSPDIFHQLIQIVTGTHVRVKLARMRSEYLRLHSITGYSEAIQTIFEQTRL